MEEKHDPPISRADEPLPDVSNKALSRREMLRLTGYGAMGLTLALTADPVGAAPTRLERALPGVRELRGAASHDNTPPTKMQLPFWGAAWSLPENYRTILFADFDGDGKPELLGRSASGIVAHQYDTVAQQFRAQFLDPTQNQWVTMPPGPVLSDNAFPVDANGNPIATPYQTSFAHPRYYETIRAADIDRDGQAEILVRWWDGVYVFHWGFDATIKQWGWTQMGAGGAPPWSDAAGWHDRQYYETIRIGDVDGDGHLELVGRGPKGVEAWKYDAARQTWTRLGDNGPPLWSDEATPGLYNYPQYYSTIHLADIDGDGRDEFVGRGVLGIEAYKYSGPAFGWVIMPFTFKPSLIWSDEGGYDKPQYYESLRVADLDGDGQVELLIRGKNGLEAIKFVVDNTPEQGHWVRIPNLIGFWSDSQGYDRPQYYESVHAADVNGDGADEMSILNGGYMEIWGLTGGLWQQLGAGTEIPGPPWGDSVGWDEQQRYDTIRFANIDGKRSPSGHPIASAFGVGLSGVEIWRFYADNPVTQWERPTASFPPFTGQALAAYQYLSQQLTGNIYMVDIRSQYAAQDVTDEQTWHDATLPNMAPAPGVPQAVWQSVQSQIIAELEYVINVKQGYGQVTTLRTQQSLQKSEQLTFVSGLLQADNINSYNAQAAAVVAAAAQNAEVNAIIGGIVGGAGAALALGGIPIAPILSGGYALFNALGGSQIWQQTVSGPVFDSAIYVKTSLLAEYLSQAEGDAQGSQDNVQNLILGDYGLLLAQGDPFDWQNSDMDKFRQRGVDAYTLWLWQTLTPLIWQQKYVSAGDFKQYMRDRNYPTQAGWAFRNHNGFWIRAKSPGNKAVNPQDASLYNIFNAPDIDDNGVNHGGLGVSVYDAYLRYGGWNLPGSTASNAASVSDRLCGGSKTEGEEGASNGATASEASDDPGLPRVAVTAERTALQDGLMTVQIGVHNRTNAIISHVEITEATLTLPGIGRRKVKPQQALPTRRQRVDRGKWALNDLTFPLPTNDPGSRVTLQVQGTYITRRPDGSNEKTSFGGSWRMSP